MRRSQFTVKQIAWALRQTEMSTPEVRELPQLSEKNRRLKGPVADLSLD